MLLWAVGLVIPALFWLVGLPLAWGWVPPFLSLDGRPARAFGGALLAAGALAAVANGILILCFGDAPRAPGLAWILLESLGWGILALIPFWLLSRRR
ncbi:MAG: hypothetical protein ACK5XD_06140 [Acidobacteriota bacterium]